MGSAGLALVALLLILLFLLLVPWDVEFQLHWGGERRSKAKVAWLFFQKDLEKTPKEEEEKKPRRKKEAKRDLALFQFFLNLDFLDRIWGYIGEMIETLRVRGLQANLRFGLSDPADTGVVLGYLWALKTMVPLPGELVLEPSFQQEVLEGSARGSVRFRPFSFICPTLRFLAGTWWQLLGMAKKWRQLH
jgi:hypothetical protein